MERPVPTDKNTKTALLFGASRGLGLGLAREYLSRGWRVIATARDNATELEALEQAASGKLRIEHVDISDADGVRELAAKLKGETLDLLFLIAGISGSVPKPLHEISPDEAARVYLTNTYYPIVAAEALSGLLKPGGVVAFMSSMLGSITLNVGRADWETYRTSKAGLNMGARSFFNRHSGHPVLSIAPGWVRTDMGGPSATFDVATSCRNVANAIGQHAGKPGHRYVNYDGTELPW
jgi:NAD(P)-dependent dehydrogenase (short-subunit alcohol dehydrogenase family)